MKPQTRGNCMLFNAVTASDELLGQVAGLTLYQYHVSITRHHVPRVARSPYSFAPIEQH